MENCDLNSNSKSLANADMGSISFGAVNQLPLIFGIDFSAVTTSSFNVRATIDTKNKDAEVTVEYGLTTDYGSEIPVNEIDINGIVPVTALLTL